jgi:phosphatidylglycerol---prolipoprotein diacylglyceryl transferase
VHHLHQIDPIIFSVGPVKLHWYGLMYVIGITAGYFLGKKRLQQGRLPVSLQAYQDLIFYAALGVIFGGRLGYMLFYGFKDWIADPAEILRVWEGGMSFHGGLIGVTLAVLLWSRRHGLRFWDSIDFVAPLVPIGLGLGRLGNYIGGELWGRVSDVPWAVIFPKSLPARFDDPASMLAAHRAGELDLFARHPSQLYELALEGLVLFVVLWLFSSKPRPRYAVSGLFGVLYGSFRFAVEFVREPDAQLGFLAFDWLTMGMLLSLPLVFVGLFLLFLAYRRREYAPLADASPRAEATP